MKYILIILFSVTIIAQEDSTKTMQSSSGTKFHFDPNDDGTSKKHIFESMLEMKADREWEKNQNEVNSKYAIFNSEVIKFKEKEPNFIDTDLFYIMAGSAVILGATAAYFKLESDSNYDEYLKTGQKSLLQKTDSYDLYSGLALGALQINFGYMIYKFLTD